MTNTRISIEEAKEICKNAIRGSILCERYTKAQIIRSVGRSLRASGFGEISAANLYDAVERGE